MLILGIACPDPQRTEPYDGHVRLLLEPWAVEAALRRRTASNLDIKDLAEAKRCTRDADTLRWPKAFEP